MTTNKAYANIKLSNQGSKTMHYWNKLFSDLHKSQMTIGELEEAINNETWAFNNDYSPEQRKYEDSLKSVDLEYEERLF